MMWSNLAAHMGTSGLGKVSPVPADKYEAGSFLSFISPNGDYIYDPSGSEVYLRCPEGTERRTGPERTGDKFAYFCYTPGEVSVFQDQENAFYAERVRKRTMYLMSLGVATVGILIYAPGYWKVTAAIPGGIIALAFAIRGLG